MGIQLVWEDDGKTVLRHIYDGSWSVQDFITAVDESRKLLLEVEYPVDLIIDMRSADGPPSGIIPAYQYADRKVPDNQRLLVMVNPTEYMKSFNRVVGKVAPRAAANRYVVESLEDAFQLIADYRAQT
jgi:hypothetical protein